jgi:hypothetical protein
MSPAAVPHPDYLITLVGPGSGAGAGVPGAAVRDAATGRVIDRVPGRKDMYSAVAGTASNRLFFLSTRSTRERAAGRDPDAGQTPPGGAFRLELNDDGTVADLSAVPGIPESGPDGYDITDLAGTADASKLMLTSRRRRRSPPAPGAPPAEIHIITVATGRRITWQAGSYGRLSYLSSSADGQRMAVTQDRAGSSGVRVIDLPGTATDPVLTMPSRMVVPEHNSLGNLGQAVIRADGATLYVTVAHYGPGGQPVTQLAEISVADGQLRRIAYERHAADPANVIFGWGPLAIDAAGQHALIAYSGNVARIDLTTGLLTELPIEENGAFDVAW